MHHVSRHILPIVLLVLLSACANRGVGPQGGPKDETPPKVVRETPQNGSLNFEGQRIEILFDEYVQLDNVATNVLISPPQQRPPEVKAYGKKVQVSFPDPLQDSTTYTIDFGSAICDNNEKNPLPGYSFAFSTGDAIDSLQVGGLLLNAEDLNPVSGVVVGIHSNLSDSALQSVPFNRITKTDAEGRFTIRNVHGGTYRIYALNDVSKDYLYQPGEGLAFSDTLIAPLCRTQTVQDTVWQDSVTVDSVRLVQTTHYEPDSLVLFYFTENKQRCYFQRVIREEQHRFTLLFAAPQDSLPVLRALGDTDWLPLSLMQVNPTRDTLVIWLTDSAAIRMDTLRFEMSYWKSDSLYNLQPQTDTLTSLWRAPRISAQAKARMDRQKQEQHPEITGNGSSPFEIYNPLRIRLTTPVSTVSTDSIRFSQRVDDKLRPLPFTLLPADSSRMVYEIHHDWLPDTDYELELDSAAFTDIYGNTTLMRKFMFHTRTLDEYSTLIVKVEPFDSRAMIQVLDDKDQPVRTLRAQPEGVHFTYLKPQSYYLRLYLDLDGDSLWTTGDYATRRQPEPVYYFPSKLTLRANWDFEETFSLTDPALAGTKPAALRKTMDATKKK
ncbi:MAG: Ig-like domain-containing protein [Paludibacteraceae bacterium]|nr:Ig-like domain-containing protein [Paludibacteraceae bacterium]